MAMLYELVFLLLTATLVASFSSPRRIVLITGGNKGIGKEIARRIGTEPGYTAIIASRNVDLGDRAVKELTADGKENGHECNVVALPLPLDLTDPLSIANAANCIEETYGVLDVLINNAAICYNDPTLYGRVEYTPFKNQAGITIRTNFFGTLKITQAFLPLLKKSSSPKIINVASAAGRLTILRSQDLIDEFTSSELTISQLSNLMNMFVSDVESGTHAQKGWPNTCYGVSKLGIIALTRVLARDHPEIVVNSVDPGYCRTDQNDNQGVIDPVDGAYTPYLLVLMEMSDDTEDEDEIVTGLHFFEEEEMSWSYQ